MLIKNTIYNQLQQTLNLNVKKTPFEKFFYNRRVLSYHLFLDMLYVAKTWRLIKGYPINGQTTYTNAHNAKKNKKFLNYRVSQFFYMFGKRRKNIYPTLVQAEYTNRLWSVMWFSEWYSARCFLRRIRNKRSGTIKLDVGCLARGQVNGFRRRGNAALLSKSKRIDDRGSLGAPFLFSKNIFFGTPMPLLLGRLIMDNGITRKIRKRKKKK